MIRSVADHLPPKTWPMHWWPRQTPEQRHPRGEAPDQVVGDPRLRGVHGPGEMMRCEGLRASISSTVILSLRKTCKVDRRVHLPQPLDQVVGEGIVVVDQENHEAAQDHADKRSSNPVNGRLAGEMDPTVLAAPPEEKAGAKPPRRNFGVLELILVLSAFGRFLRIAGAASGPSHRQPP